MKKISDYIVEFLLKNNLNTLFTITGGFSMHLNNSFGKTEGYEIYYQHHEQASGYSAVGYSKTNSKPCIVCTTAGVAATNAISPCLVAYQDSLPILFISGQSKSTDITRALNNEKMTLRHYSGQDCDIISMVKPITKFAYEITKIEEINEILIKAISNLINGRPGPVWLSVPIDIQGYLMDEIEIPIIEKNLILDNINLDVLQNVDKLIKESNRPLIILGNGIKLGHCNKKFRYFIEKYKIPVVATFHGLDILETDHKLFTGRIGLVGDRSGNFSLQNCDLLISMGCRMAQGIIGYRSDWFAREAKIVYIDNDQNELEKNNINYELKINMDLNDFFDNYHFSTKDFSEWIKKCNHWKNKWSYELPEDLNDNNGINPYYTLKKYFELAPENKITICASGSILNIIWHMANIKKDDKFIISSQGDMGFELTAAIGSAIAEKNKMIVPIFGEGSLQFNIQELQTIVHNKLPIKILLINNNAYGANLITQSIYFKNKYGSDNESNLSFPNTEKIASAYGIKYLCARNNLELEETLNNLINFEGPLICEIFSSVQIRIPKISAIKNEDGTFNNRPFEDLEPFLSREEFKNEMIVKIV